MRYFVIDGMNLVWRAYHASSGNAGTLLGSVLHTVAELRLWEPNSKYAIAWEGYLEDDSKPVWRKKVYSAYKATRKAVDDGSREKAVKCARRLHKLFRAMGAASWIIPGVEGDDLISLMAHKLAERKRVLIVSNDSDYFQLVKHPRIAVLIHDRNKRTPLEVNAAVLLARYGVPARSWLVYRALTGDSSDNITGVAGVGPVKAKTLLSGGFDGDFTVNPGKRLLAAQPEAEAQFKLSKKLYKLPSSLERARFDAEQASRAAQFLDSPWPSVDRYAARMAFLRFCDRWSLPHLAGRFDALLNCPRAW